MKGNPASPVDACIVAGSEADALRPQAADQSRHPWATALPLMGSFELPLTKLGIGLVNFVDETDAGRPVASSSPGLLPSGRQVPGSSGSADVHSPQRFVDQFWL